MRCQKCRKMLIKSFVNFPPGGIWTSLTLVPSLIGHFQLGTTAIYEYTKPKWMEEQHAEHKQLWSELDFGIWIWSLSQFTCNGDSQKTDCEIPLLNTRWRYPSFHWVDKALFLVNVIYHITGATESGGILNNRKMWHPEGLIHLPLKLILCRYDPERENCMIHGCVWLSSSQICVMSFRVVFGVVSQRWANYWYSWRLEVKHTSTRE